MGVIYFPFLIVALFITILSSLCNIRKSSVKRLGSKGGSTYFQNNVTTILACIGPLQFLAIGASVGLCFLFKLFVSGVIYYVLMITSLLINLAFLITFCCTFHNQKDQEFSKYRKRYPGCSKVISPLLTLCCSFKCNKMYYSNFGGFDMFKATWTSIDCYKIMLVVFGVVHIILIDLSAIYHSSIGMLHLDWNQLYVTLIEVFVLSLAGLILGIVELIHSVSSLSSASPEVVDGETEKLDIQFSRVTPTPKFVTTN